MDATEEVDPQEVELDTLGEERDVGGEAGNDAAPARYRQRNVRPLAIAFMTPEQRAALTASERKEVMRETPRLSLVAPSHEAATMASDALTQAWPQREPYGSRATEDIAVRLGAFRQAFSESLILMGQLLVIATLLCAYHATVARDEHPALVSRDAFFAHVDAASFTCESATSTETCDSLEPNEILFLGRQGIRKRQLCVAFNATTSPRNELIRLNSSRNILASGFESYSIVVGLALFLGKKLLLTILSWVYLTLGLVADERDFAGNNPLAAMRSAGRNTCYALHVLFSRLWRLAVPIIIDVVLFTLAFITYIIDSFGSSNSLGSLCTLRDNSTPAVVMWSMLATASCLAFVAFCALIILKPWDFPILDTVSMLRIDEPEHLPDYLTPIAPESNLSTAWRTLKNFVTPPGICTRVTGE